MNSGQTLNPNSGALWACARGRRSHLPAATPTSGGSNPRSGEARPAYGSSDRGQFGQYQQQQRQRYDQLHNEGSVHSAHGIREHHLQQPPQPVPYALAANASDCGEALSDPRAEDAGGVSSWHSSEVARPVPPPMSDQAWPVPPPPHGSPPPRPPAPSAPSESLVSSSSISQDDRSGERVAVSQWAHHGGKTVEAATSQARSDAYALAGSAPNSRTAGNAEVAWKADGSQPPPPPPPPLQMSREVLCSALPRGERSCKDGRVQLLLSMFFISVNCFRALMGVVNM